MPDSIDLAARRSSAPKKKGQIGRLPPPQPKSTLLPRLCSPSSACRELILIKTPLKSEHSTTENCSMELISRLSCMHLKRRPRCHPHPHFFWPMCVLRVYINLILNASVVHDTNSPLTSHLRSSSSLSNFLCSERIRGAATSVPRLPPPRACSPPCRYVHYSARYALASPYLHATASYVSLFSLC
jgi:hypothetical protein